MNPTFGKRVNARPSSNTLAGVASATPPADVAQEAALASHGQSSTFSGFLKAHPYLAAFAVIAAIGSGLRTEDTTAQSGGNCTGEQREAARSLIRMNGYACQPVDFCLQSSWDGSYRVTCNGNRYVYGLEDRGGNWTVVLK